jgi:hypothetical protein
MKTYRAVATVLLAFLLGGSSAEVAVQTRRAIHRARAAEPVEGAGGSLLALELRAPDGMVIARPRLIAAPGRAAHLIVRDPRNPEQVRLTLRLEASREPSGDVAVDWELTLPGELRPWTGRASATPGVELALDLGDRPYTATLLALPVPSAAFDAFLEAERRMRHT